MRLFEGQDLRVEHDPGDGSTAALFITFTSRHKTGVNKEGFGASFFAKRGMPALHFISKRNHWWQTPEMAPALTAALSVRAPYARVVTYGSSMGGHGALLFSAQLKADAALAFVPQFAINGRGAPWHRLWQADTRGVAELHRMEEGLSRTADIVVAYDPLNAVDPLHVDCIAKIAPITRLPFSFSGHATASAVADLGLLPGLVLSMKDGLTGAREALIAYRRRKTESVIVWREAGKWAQQTHRKRLQHTALLKCEDVAFGRLKAGALRDADPMFDYIAGKYDRDPDAFTHDVFRRALAEHPMNALPGYLVSRWLADMGRLEAARMEAQAALRLAPRQATLALHLVRLHYATGSADAGAELLQRTLNHPKINRRAVLARERGRLLKAGIPAALLDSLATPATTGAAAGT